MHLNLNYSDERGFNPTLSFCDQKDKDRHYITRETWDIQEVFSIQK